MQTELRAASQEIVPGEQGRPGARKASRVPNCGKA